MGVQDCPRECFSQGDSRTSGGLLVFCVFLIAHWKLLVTQRQQHLSSSVSSPLTGTSNVKLLVLVKTKASQTFPGFLFPCVCRLLLTPFAASSPSTSRGFLVWLVLGFGFWFFLTAEEHRHSNMLHHREVPSIIRDTSPFLMPCLLDFSRSNISQFLQSGLMLKIS